MTLFNGIKWSLHFVHSPNHHIDFRTYYFSSQNFWKEQNPYSDSAQQASIQNYHDSKLVAGGFPHATAVYAPEFVWYFGLYNLLSYRNAQYLDFVLNILSILGIIWGIKRINPQLPIGLIALSIFSFRGSWYAIDTGQPMLQVLAISIFAYWGLIHQKHPLLIGSLFAIVSFKFTLLLPFIFLLFLAKDKRYLWLYLAVTIILNCAVLLLSNQPEILLASWQSNLSKLWAYPHVHQSLNELNTISSNASTALVYFFDLPLPLLKSSMSFLLLMSYGFVYLKHKHLSDSEILFFLLLSNLCFGQHLIYDALALLVFKLLSINKDMHLHWTEILLLTCLCLPLGSMSKFMQMPALNFALNISLILTYVVVFKTYFWSRYRAIKKPN